jgi:putative hydrolase of the HAD superfamily
MGLVTNGAVDSQQPKIDGLGIARYFDTILISEAEGVAKPDAEIFRRATDNLGVSPDRVVMIGDNPEADIRGAKFCGMKAIWKRDKYWEAPEIVDAVIDDLDELPSTIRNLA